MNPVSAANGARRGRIGIHCRSRRAAPVAVDEEKRPVFAVDRSRLAGDAGFKPLRRPAPRVATNFGPQQPGQPFAKRMMPLSQATRIVSLAANLPSRMALASGFSICCWIARFNGLAP